ncbi:MAG: OmpA family protein [Saprospiraceae bacterium]
MLNIEFKILLFAIVSTFLVSCSTTKQVKPSSKLSNEELMASSDLQYRQNNVEGALSSLDQVLQTEPNNAKALSRKGAILYNQNKKTEAFEYLQKAVAADQTNDADILFSAFMAADAVESLPLAITYGERLQKLPNLTSARQIKVNQMLAQIKLKQKFFNNAQDMKLEKLPSEINTTNLEYLPRISLNDESLFFVRKVYDKEMIYVSTKNGDTLWSEASPFEAWASMESAGAFSIAEDKSRAILTLCYHPKGIGSCDLFLSRKVNGLWSQPAHLGDVINSREWDAQPCFSADGSRIYFSSTRKGGYGGSDIYVINIVENKWQEPVNLGPNINSPGNDDAPFIHADGQTLYFRSDGWPGMGSYDLFMTRLDQDGKVYTDPVNLGHPINTAGDDGAFALSPNGKTAYYATDYFSKQSNEIPNLDIITFTLPESLRSIPTTYLLLEIVDAKTEKTIAAEFEIIDLSTSHKLTKSQHLPNISRPIPIKSGSNLGLFIQKNGYLPHSENFKPEFGRTADEPYKLVVKLQPITERQPIVLNNIFFDTNSSKLKSESYPELDKLVGMLQNEPQMKIKLLGHTDSIGEENDNQLLSENRAKSVYQYLIDHGITTSRLSYQGLGETKPIASNDTEEGRFMNRRTEFIVVE